MNRAASSLLLALILLLSAPAHAVVTFKQIDQNTFSVSHKIKGFGSRGKATDLVFTKAASLCVAAGFSHYRVMSQESQSAAPLQPANATLTIKLFFEDSEDRTACEPSADPEYVREIEGLLSKLGYEQPSPQTQDPDKSSEPEVAATTNIQGCSLEQIAAMARAGLTDERIRAACSEEASDP